MGCLGSIGISVKAEPDPEIVKLIASIDTRLEEYKKTFETEVNKIKEKQTDALNKRHEELTKLKAEKGEIPEDAIKKLNESELKWEIDILTNQVDQLHYIFETGLDLVEPIKKITLNKLMEQVKTAPAMAANTINKQIAEIKSMPSIDFLRSTYGKVLKDALVKKGMRKERNSVLKLMNLKMKLLRKLILNFQNWLNKNIKILIDIIEIIAEIK